MARSVLMTHQPRPPSESMKPNSDSDRNAVPASGRAARMLATSATNSAMGTKGVFIGSQLHARPGPAGHDGGGARSIIGRLAAENKGGGALKELLGAGKVAAQTGRGQVRRT